MPRLLGFPERPRYSSVERYLSELAKDLAEIVVDSEKMERFRKHLRKYDELWKTWTTADEADRNGCWTPSMGRPEYPLNVFSRNYNIWYDPEKEIKSLPGFYSILAFIHDKQLPNLNKINNGIVSSEIAEKTLSVSRTVLEHTSDMNLSEMYLIEEFYNHVKIDLKEHFEKDWDKSKTEELTKTKHKQQAETLSDVELFDSLAKKFKSCAINVLKPDATWQSLDRLLKEEFALAMQCLQQAGKEKEVGLLKYLYKNLLHFARGINFKSFRGFPDESIVASERKHASELAEKFKDLAQRTKISHKPEKKENESDDTVELLKKDYLSNTEDRLKKKIGSIVQDFISRGLANTTVCVGKQLEACFDYNNKMIDHIIESLHQKFADIPLTNFKEKLLTIVDEEYKKLIPFANSRLVTAGLAQTNILKQFEQHVNNKKEKAKQTIETRIAILEKQNKTSKAKRKAEYPERVNNGTKEGREGIIAVRKPFYKKRSAKIIGVLSALVLITTVVAP